MARQRKNTIERSVYRSADQDQPITRLALDPFDTPFRIDDAKPVASTSSTPRRAPLLPADLTQRLVETEVNLLNAALDKARFNQTMAADLLGLSYHQFRKFNIRSKP